MYDTFSAFTTFGIGGKIGKLVIASDRNALIDNAENAIVLGRGSKVLASDDGYDGTVVINRYARVVTAGTFVVVGSGATLPALCAMLADIGLSGMEWAEGIPGTVGGAVRMNAGAFGGQISDRIVFADILRNGNVVRLSATELGLGYRSSALLPNDTVIDAGFRLTRGEPAEIKARCRSYAAERSARQPKGKSAGSIFKNPQGMAIGKLIEDVGLKGYRRGGAMISDEHANIIVNTGGATARDVREIITTVKSELNDRYGIHAKEELIYIGGS